MSQALSTDVLIVGGGIANTFLKAQGYPIGKSLYEPHWVEKAKELLKKAERKGIVFPLPKDVVVAPAMDRPEEANLKPVDKVGDDDIIFDVGSETQKCYDQLLKKAKKIIWNGPIGVFEVDAFSQGTRAIAQAIANSDAKSIAGGGDTIAALNQFGLFDNISYVSTGGGAFLEYVEGREFPIIDILADKFYRGIS